MDPIDALTRFGLTQQEAAVYVQLCSDGPQNGYEVAKATGISRSNAYSALAGLADKGGADTQAGTPVRYAAVPPAEFCGARIGTLQKLGRELEAQVKLRRSDPVTEYLTVRGHQRIAARMEAMLESAIERVYLSVPKAMLDPLLPRLAVLVASGLKVVVLAVDPPDLPGAIRYRQPNADGRVRLIVDSRLVLTGSLDSAEPTCLYSADIHLIELFKDALRNEIRLIETST